MHTAADPSSMLEQHRDRITLVCQYANEADPADFDRRWLSVLRCCAAWFSSMPLRPDQHAEPGGAFRASVEAAYFAMRLSGGQKFGADQPSERRRALEPQYLHALFLAACCSRLDEPYRNFQFFRNRDNAEWVPVFHGAFGPWLGQDTYRVVRRESAEPVQRMRTALLARDILGAERLEQFDSVVMSDLLGSINPDPRPTGLETLLHKVARQAIDAVTQFEIKARRAAFSPDTTAAPSAALLSASGIVSTGVAPVAPSLPVAPATKEVAPPASDPPGQTDAPAGGQGRPQENGATSTLPETERPSVLRLDGERTVRKEVAGDPFSAVLTTPSNLMRDFFRALSQDVTAGKVKVAWVDNRLAIPKRVLSNYGIASETLLDNLRKQQLLFKQVGQDILLVDKVGSLIAPRPASSNELQ
ncbi:TraI domain-containing protein [Cupriavidus basilensis]|uniref:TraI domain-containing protein n=1 Tax=Cupriavidus basilensis TaxID=68895 RepID=UPI0007509562|nr:TraI domain-containing protein [Cupriavidus basilensis]